MIINTPARTRFASRRRQAALRTQMACMVILFVGSCACCAVSAPCQGADAGPAKTTQEYRSMIDALANKNMEPRLIVRADLSAPDFPTDHDFAEDLRVRRVFFALARDESEELWEELLKHLDDRRYSFTMAEDGRYALNYTVRGICKKIAYHRLHSAFEELLPIRFDGLPFYPDMLHIEDQLAEWRKRNAGKTLYELQIEACQAAIRALEMEGRLSMEEIRESCAKIRARIDRLRRTKRAIFQRLPFDAYHWYKEDESARIEKRLEKEGGK